MSIYKIKRFSKKKEAEMSFGDRVRETSVAALFGGLLGVIPGTIVGSLLPIKGSTKMGALLGAGLGAYAAGKVNWKFTSKEAIEERERRKQEIAKKNEEFIKNPKSYLNPILNKKDSDYMDQGLPKEFFKLLQANRTFIPIAEKLIKKNKALWSPSYVVLEPNILKGWRENNDEDEGGVTIMIDPEHADDTYINWYPEDNTYSTDFYDSNREASLKKLLIKLLSINIEYSDDSYSLKFGENDPRLEIDKAYLEHIMRNM